LSTVDLRNADCLAAMRAMPDNSVDAVLTDPPYGLGNTTSAQVTEAIIAWTSGDREFLPSGRGFMGKEWDAFVPPVAVWDEAMRVLKPGGHMAVFSGARTVDLMGLSIRLAGFEIRDVISWLYGSGFPKSMDVSKAIDKAAGATREVIGKSARHGGGVVQLHGGGIGAEVPDITAPATDAAKQWAGYGTALKPAHEPIILARKPFAGTVAANVLQHGTGALNIDASRIGTGEARPLITNAGRKDTRVGGYGAKFGSVNAGQTTTGRFPANVILDESQAAVLDAQSGISKSRSASMPLPMAHSFGGVIEGPTSDPNRDTERGHNDSGGASRFFYVAKAGKKERPVVDGVAHPTVKPLPLMQYLARLITPAGGTVLEPFAGSGTTVEACILEGFDVIAIERDPSYIPLIQARIDRSLPADNYELNEAA
jgi:site-specific DNA-methyltransferase (adenine-specific)